jgi:hypothetical protein
VGPSRIAPAAKLRKLEVSIRQNYAAALAFGLRSEDAFSDNGSEGSQNLMVGRPLLGKATEATMTDLRNRGV